MREAGLRCRTGWMLEMRRRKGGMMEGRETDQEEDGKGGMQERSEIADEISYRDVKS